MATTHTTSPDDTRTVGVTCTHDCQDACRTEVTVQNGIAIGIKADRSHPVTGRHLCVKVDNYLDRVYDKNRILTPLRRTGPKGCGIDGFEPISWDQAIKEISTRWKHDIASNGAESILGYSYYGSMGTLAGFGTNLALMHRMGASKLGRTVCGNQWSWVSALTGFPNTDTENLPDAKLIIVWGMDPVSKSIHTWDLIRKARKAGAKMVVIDPYRSDTAKRADVHVRPHLGTDGALALAMAHVIIRDDLLDTEFVAERTSDFDELAAAVADWTPERAEAETGVDANIIVELANSYATQRPAAITVGVGMQRAFGSATAIRAIQCLPALTGQWRWAAGGVARGGTFGDINMGALMRPDLSPPGTRELNMLKIGQHLTDQTLEPAVSSLFVWNSNPAVIAPDQGRVLEGLRRDDLFTVVHDQFLTDTARHADIVLPATTMLESSDLTGSWGYNYVGLNRAAIDPVGESKSNAEVVRLLAAAMEFEDKIFTLSDDQLIDIALDNPKLGSREQFERDGFQRVGDPAGTPIIGNFAFSSEALTNVGLPASVGYLPPANPAPSSDDSPYPLRLLTLKRHHSINTSYGSLPVMNADPRPTAELHPADAKHRGLTEGDEVRIFNQLGSISCQLRITDATPAGTAAVPFGHWGESGVNSLTSDLLGDLGDGPTFCDNLVEVASI